MQIDIVKTVNGMDRSLAGAFSAKDALKITLRIPRALQLISPRMVICSDGEVDRELIPAYGGFNESGDIFTFDMDLTALCGDEGHGLFYYEFRFEQNYKTVYTSSINNVDFTLTDHPARRFLLLVHQPSFTTPKAFYGTTMYHIFVDRFAKSAHETPVRSDAILREDWEDGIPEYAPYPGAPLKNNQFFGGSLWGVIEKLDYLKSLSVSCIYLSPIFKAYSNHKYDTGDYGAVDEMFGGREALDALLAACKARDIKVILDGVFNHTGDDSLYFNRYGKYPSVGAYQSEQSPYRDWYHFHRYPTQYESWWGIEVLPKLNTDNRTCREYLVGEDGICAKYVRAGTNGWRLDVVDELSDGFLDRLRTTVKAVDPNAILIGEVWENAAEKVAYSRRRRYLRGRQLDSVMNYPVKNAIIDYVKSGDCSRLYDTVTEIYASYPRCTCDCLMNLLGTHDTERILTVLGGKSSEGMSSDALAHTRMDEKERERGIQLLKIASALQYTLYGFPSVFYGDEAGIEGYGDPFCRMPFPWGRENEELLAHYRTLGKLRREHSAYAGGDFRVTAHDGGLFAFVRENGKEALHTITNRASFPIRYTWNGKWRDISSGEVGEGSVEIPSNGFRIIKIL